MAFTCGRRGGGWASLPSLPTSCLACFFLCVILCRAEPQPLDQLPVKSYAYASFQPSDSPSTLRVLADAGIIGGALQLTRDGFRGHRSGSVLLDQPFTLWRRLDGESPAPSPATAAATAASRRDQRVRVVSFISTFSMSVAYYNKALPGEGLAFLIAPSSAGPPSGSQDGFLGLTNATLEASPAANQFVAVEFDTVKQSYDPNDNHVGLDIGTVLSNKTANLADFNITIATDDTVAGAVNYTVWIEYDGVARRISVYMDARGKERPASPVLDAPLDLSEHVPEQSYIGFSGSTGATVGLNSILEWTLTMETFPEKKDSLLILWTIYVGSFGSYLLLMFIMFCILNKCLQRQEEKARHERRKERLRHMLSNLPGKPTEFEYEELEKATEKFKERLSQSWTGGYAYVPGTVVYKGLLSTKDGWSKAMEVAVKSYNFGHDEDLHSVGGHNDIKTSNLLRHQNIVSIIGWCCKHDKQLRRTSLYQVFEYQHLSNGSLDTHLYRRDTHEERHPALSWGTRYGIVADVASSLHYMHHECSSVVLHRDIKPSNVMLDASFRARLSEFGLALVIEPNKSSSDRVLAGTPGYIAPEYYASREATRRTDVFAFGTFVLQVVTGRHALLNEPDCPLLSDWVWWLHGESTLLVAVDLSLCVAGFDEDVARRLLLLGMACSSPNPSDRPTMPQVQQIISKSAPPPEVPMVKPTFVWPPAPEEDAAENAFDESFRFAAPSNSTHDFFPTLSSGR